MFFLAFKVCQNLRDVKIMYSYKDQIARLYLDNIILFKPLKNIVYQIFLYRLKIIIRYIVVY
jgi:hypothetical protein